MNTKVVLLLAVVALAAADKRPRPTYGAPPPPPPPPPSYSAPEPPRPVYSAPESSEEVEDPPKYAFNWEVEDHYSGNDFDHQEEREYDNTKGSYSVQLPDGRLQKVTYYVDGDSGYIAEVTYEGEAQYPESEESRESYGPPQPTYSAPESEESEEAPVYAPPPRPSYAPPQPSYAPPRRTYGTPQ
ncbi:uncharacterized protein LOC135115242 [Scylla paramamosain]|uniref:uncharacterized protein LOC135115242 n=1 Tax=Scylla paramamosain TaxID=85552 RepID=UPI003082C61E